MVQIMKNAKISQILLIIAETHSKTTGRVYQLEITLMNYDTVQSIYWKSLDVADGG